MSHISIFNLNYNLSDKSIIEFIENHPQSSIYHHPSWLNALSETVGEKVFYLLIRNNSGVIEGLMPFLTVNKKFIQKKIISLPLSTYCDPLIEKSKLNEAIQFLRKEFKDYKIIDIRTRENLQNELVEFSINKEYYTHILKLKDSIEETFNSFHPTSVRASIRRAEKNNLEIEWGSSEKHLKIFYKLEFRLRKRLLLPPIPYKFFKNVFNELIKSGMIFIPVVYKDNIPIAAGFILKFKDTYYLEYTAADKDFFHLYPNHKLFYGIIKEAHNSGAKFVDFGRTAADNISLISFKEKWAAEKIPLYHYTYPQSAVSGQKKSLRKVLMSVNSYLPDSLLKIEGELLYRFFL